MTIESIAPRLQMNGIRKAYGATQALGGVDLEIRGGEIHALIGENGAGKSTLMKVLSGAIRPDEGTILLDGMPYSPNDPRGGRQSGVAMIYQELSLAPHLTVAENIFLGIEPKFGLFVNRAAMVSGAREALHEVGRPDIPAEIRTDRLSIADQQLVEIARSVAIGCKVLVLDEPTSSITSRDVANLFGLMRRLRDRGIAIIYISHFLEEIAQISDRYTVLRDGKSVGTGITKETTSDAIVQKMVGRQVETLYPRTKRTASETVLRVSNVAGKRLPIDASLELRRGEVLGIAGLIGSGRTELIRAIYGLDSVEHGQVQIAMLRNITPAKMWECGAGLVSEDRKQEGLALKLSIADNMTLPRLSGLGPLGLVFPAKQRAACKPLIQQLSIRCHDPDQQVGQLSGGNQQKVAIARLLHSQADILIFDEPTRGIDVGSKAQIYQLIDRLVSMPDANGKCKAVLFISSYLPELLGMCDRIHVMRRGVLNPARTALGLTEHDIMLEATGVGTKE